MGLPIHDAARRALAHAGHVLAEDIAHAEHDLSKLTHHSRYHQQQATANAVPEAPPMSLISTLEADFEEVRAKVEEFAASKLPTALDDVKKLEGNPIIPVLLEAAHVPASALQWVVEGIQAISKAFPKPGEAEAVSDAPSAPQVPAAGPVVAGQA